MIIPGQNYEQDKINGVDKQTVILDEAETSETDQLDPKFHDDPINDPVSPDGEKTNEDREETTEPTANDADLNHDADDDLSLNKPADEVF